MQYGCTIYWLWEELPVLFPNYTRVVVRDGSRQAACRPLGGRHAAKHALCTA
jgi:hypothetical protein